MRKIALLALVLLLALIPVAGVSAQGDPASGAVNWLLEQQSEDGSFNQDVATTAYAAIAIAGVTGEANEAALGWLETYITENAADLTLDEMSLSVLAVSASGGDVTAFAEGALLGGFMGELQQQRGDNVPGLCLGLVAMGSTGAPLPPTALSGLSALQAEDGSFADTEMGLAVPVTAVCAHVLALAGETESLEAALAFLDEAQLEDGGWGFAAEDTTSNLLSTGFVLMAANAAGADLNADYGDAVGLLFSQQLEDGAFPIEVGGTEGDIITTSLIALIFRGLDFTSFAPAAEGEEAAPEATEEPESGAEEGAAIAEGPALDPAWAAVADGFSMTELDTADDFFVTVVDPFTGDELYGAQILNWTAEYQYTPFLIEEFLTADALLFMAEQDATFWESLNDTVLALLPAEVLAELPEEVQARVQ